jgi:hypothetical protein
VKVGRVHAAQHRRAVLRRTADGWCSLTFDQVHRYKVALAEQPFLNECTWPTWPGHRRKTTEQIRRLGEFQDMAESKRF